MNHLLFELYLLDDNLIQELIKLEIRNLWLCRKVMNYSQNNILFISYKSVLFIIINPLLPFYNSQTL